MWTIYDNLNIISQTRHNKNVFLWHLFMFIAASNTYLWYSDNENDNCTTSGLENSLFFEKDMEEGNNTRTKNCNDMRKYVAQFLKICCTLLVKIYSFGWTYNLDIFIIYTHFGIHMKILLVRAVLWDLKNWILANQINCNWYLTI